MWRKARASGSNGGNCVEVGSSPASAVVGLRDSKRPEAGHLAVDRAVFAALLARIKNGQYDLA
jgi:Domain of unknown function (DUF397)